MLKNLLIAVMIISITLFTAFSQEEHKKDHSPKSTKNQTAKTVENKPIENKPVEKVSETLSKFVLENLLTNQMVNIDFSSSRSVVVFLDKETIRDYNQVNNFSKWLEQKKLDVKVYTVVNGSNKQDVVNLVKTNNITGALWDTTKTLTQQLKVQKYPVAYYIVNGKVIDKTEKIDVGHLKQMVYCNQCEEVRTSTQCCTTKNHHQKMNKEQNKGNDKNKREEKSK